MTDYATLLRDQVTLTCRSVDRFFSQARVPRLVAGLRGIDCVVGPAVSSADALGTVLHRVRRARLGRSTLDNEKDPMGQLF